MLTPSVHVFALGLGLIGVRSSASDLSAQWHFPSEGILKIYGFDAELTPENLQHAAGHVVLLGEDAADHRVHFDGAAQGTSALERQVTVGSSAGLGAGEGRTGQLAFAGSTNAAAAQALATQKVGAAVIATESTAVTSGDAKGKQKLTPQTWFALAKASLSLAFVIKTLCMMCNICYQVSPLPLITSYKTKGDTGDADLAPFIATCYGGWQWCFYGLFAYMVTAKSGFLVLVYSNFVGATLGLYYVYAFNSNCRNELMIEKTKKYYWVLASIVAVQAVAIMTQQPVRALFFSGIISSVWSTIASSSLIATVPTVFETKSSASLPLPLLVMGVISASLWVVCGVMLRDPWITFPNSYAFAVCAFALFLCAKFPAGRSEFDALSDGSPGTVKDPDGADAPRCIDMEHASPLQRARGEARALAECRDAKGKYGATGGTGDSF